MRAVSSDWPAVGATLHHSLGSWPLLIDDTAHVLVQQDRPGAQAPLWGSRSRPELLTGSDRPCPVAWQDHGRVAAPALPDFRPASSTGCCYSDAPRRPYAEASH